MQKGPRDNEPGPGVERTAQPFESPEEILEVETIELDPVLSGFTGVTTELSSNGDIFTLYQFAAGTGNRLLFVQSKDENMIRELFVKETDEMRHIALLYDNPPAGAP